MTKLEIIRERVINDLDARSQQGRLGEEDVKVLLALLRIEQGTPPTGAETDTPLSDETVMAALAELRRR